MRTSVAVCVLAIVFGLTAAPASAQDLVYEPTNPAFGGRSVNYSWLLNSANQQNPYEESQGFGSFRDDPLQNFQNRLQRRVLDQLSRELIQDRFGDVDLTQEGTYDFQNFRVEVTPGPGGISIQVFNKETGETSTVEIPRF